MEAEDSRTKRQATEGTLSGDNHMNGFKRILPREAIEAQEPHIENSKCQKSLGRVDRSGDKAGRKPRLAKRTKAAAPVACDPCKPERGLWMQTDLGGVRDRGIHERGNRGGGVLVSKSRLEIALQDSERKRVYRTKFIGVSVVHRCDQD